MTKQKKQKKSTDSTSTPIDRIPNPDRDLSTDSSLRLLDSTSTPDSTSTDSSTSTPPDSTSTPDPIGLLLSSLTPDQISTLRTLLLPTPTPSTSTPSPRKKRIQKPIPESKTGGYSLKSEGQYILDTIYKGLGSIKWDPKRQIGDHWIIEHTTPSTDSSST